MVEDKCVFSELFEEGGDVFACLAALMLHFVGQGLQQGTFPCSWGSQEQCHATRLDGSTDVV